MKEIATGKLTQIAGRYAEHAPAATSCCMACRTCVTSNAIALAAVPTAALAAGIRRLIKGSGPKAA